MMTETASSRAAGTTACPYAAALNADDEHSSGTSSAEDHVEHEEALQACPAFRQGFCPFRDQTSAESVRQTLLRIPPSHFERGGKFYRVLQRLHEVAGTEGGDSTFHLAGGCPVASSIAPSDREEHVSFSEAMEGLSLAAIMARMAEDEEERGGRIGSDQEGEAKRGRPGTAAEVIDAAETDAARQTTHRHDVGASTPLLSESFKAGTAASHQAAENVHFVKEFIKGKIDRTLYGELVIMLYHVYAMLETCLEQNSSNAHLNPFQQFHKRLRRTETLEEDVDFWHGSDKAERVLKGDSIESPACRDYVERLRTITEQDPLLLLAHSYTRYLGDLSGGKILARVARKAMNLGKPCPSGAVDGLAFYHFAEIDSAKQFKDAYRKAMDELPLTTEQVSRLVGEANVAFALNMRLFEELDVQAKVPGAAVRPLQEALAYAEVDVQIETAKKDEKCPFAKMQEMSSKGAEAAHAKSGKRCPWPFILAHDPVEGLKDWQTWAVLGLVLCYLWSKFVYHQ